MDLYSQFSPGIADHLRDADDAGLWSTAVGEVMTDATFLCRHRTVRTPIYARVGCCSHWLSPHNNGSWFRDGRFAWPSGYGGSGWSIRGLPEFD